MEFEKLITEIESLCREAENLSRKVDKHTGFTTRPNSTHAAIAAHNAVWEVYESLMAANALAKKNLWFAMNWQMIAKEKFEPIKVKDSDPDDPFCG